MIIMVKRRCLVQLLCDIEYIMGERLLSYGYFPIMGWPNQYTADEAVALIKAAVKK